MFLFLFAAPHICSARRSVCRHLSWCAVPRHTGWFYVSHAHARTHTSVIVRVAKVHVLVLVLLSFVFVICVSVCVCVSLALRRGNPTLQERTAQDTRLAQRHTKPTTYGSVSKSTPQIRRTRKKNRMPSSKGLTAPSSLARTRARRAAKRSSPVRGLFRF